MQRVSVLKVIWNDYLAFLLTIGGPIMLSLAAFTAIFGFIPGHRGQTVGPQVVWGMTIFDVLLTVLLLVLLARRISLIKKVLATGPRTTAKVQQIWFFKDRGRVEFEYLHGGQQRNAGMAIMKNAQTTLLKPGSEIEVALDPANPDRALVVQLYCSP